jgi:hypothetical protein
VVYVVVQFESVERAKEWVAATSTPEALKAILENAGVTEGEI